MVTSLILVPIEKKEKREFYIYCCKGTRFKEPEVLFTLLSSEDLKKYWLKYWEDKPVEEDKTILVKLKNLKTLHGLNC